MVVWKLPPEFTPCLRALRQHLHARLAERLPVLLLGVLMARGRRTVTSWLRGAGIGKGYPAYYYLLRRLGQTTEAIAASLLRLLLGALPLGERLVFGLDDTPTQRYGPKVQGAGRHHNPTPGPTDQQFLYGHLWVTLAWLARHPRWGTIGLPLLALLYIRRQDVPKLPARYGWAFQTKLELAVRLVQWLARWARFLGKPLWVVTDGGYAKGPFLKPALAAGVTLVGRLRKDAALRDLPPTLPPGRRRGPGRPRTYGTHKISLAKRAGQKRGWQQVEATLYGQPATKQVKTFLATWAPVGGVLRVVLVRETSGWVAFFSTDPDATAATILEMVSARASLEQDFHDLKEVEGLGQQQVRDVWANVGAFHVCLWAHALVEWWAWSKDKPVICNRRASVWDQAARRPSHADRRKGLQRACIREQILRAERRTPLAWKIRQVLRGLLKLAC